MATDDATTVLVLEDDPAIADVLDLYLRQAGFRVVLVTTGADALDRIARDAPALGIFDVGLPGGLDGIEVCRRLRAAGNPLPVLIVTARDDEIDRVLGLEMGADDYVTKPFSPREVVARVRALLRRAATPAAASAVAVTVGAVTVDEARREASVDGQVTPLATREFDLLAFLARNRGLALTRRQLIDGVWGADWYGDDRTVDVHVRQLRRKLGGPERFPLATIWGVGYRLD